MKIVTKLPFSKVKHSSVTNSQNIKRMGVDSISSSDFVAKMWADIILLQDIFVVDKLTKEDTFDKVSFIEARSYYDSLLMQLCVNTEIYPMDVSDRFVMVVTRTLNLNGKAETESGYITQEEAEEEEEELSADSFEYVICGKLYTISEAKEGNSGESEQTFNLEIEITFTGLLKVLKGNPSHVSQLEHDRMLFFRIRKL